jgi:hypothetical protein
MCQPPIYADDLTSRKFERWVSKPGRARARLSKVRNSTYADEKVVGKVFASGNHNVVSNERAFPE